MDRFTCWIYIQPMGRIALINSPVSIVWWYTVYSEGNVLTEITTVEHERTSTAKGSAEKCILL